MTAERRLEAIEAHLSPTELVVGWLEAAHAHGSLDAYVRATLDDSKSPLDELAWAAVNGVRARLKGRPKDEIAKAHDAAVRSVVFRYQLVLRINTLGHEFLERQALLDMVFTSQVAMLANVGVEGRAEAAHRQRWVELLGVILPRVVELRAHEQARDEVEAIYLGGHPALFSDDQADWADRRERTSEVAGLALGLSHHDGLPGGTPAPDPDPTPELVAAIVASFVEPAKVVTYELLGDGQRAYRTATIWLRSTYEATGG